MQCHETNLVAQSICQRRATVAGSLTVGAIIDGSESKRASAPMPRLLRAQQLPAGWLCLYSPAIGETNSPTTPLTPRVGYVCRCYQDDSDKDDVGSHDVGCNQQPGRDWTGGFRGRTQSSTRTSASCMSRQEAGNFAGRRPAIWSSATSRPSAPFAAALSTAHMQVVEARRCERRG